MYLIAKKSVNIKQTIATIMLIKGYIDEEIAILDDIENMTVKIKYFDFFALSSSF